MALLPPDFFLNASLISLEDLELAARNRSGNLSKVLRHELDMWVEHEATAMMARWFIENRETLARREITPEITPKSTGLFAKERKKLG